MSKIKRRVFSIISMAMGLFMIGCSSFGSESFDEEKLTNLAKEYSIEMATGEFSNISSNFSKEVRSQIDENSLKEIFDGVVKEIGTYEDVNEVSYLEQGKNAIVEVILKYELNGIKVMIVFDGSKKVSGINFNYAPIKEELTSNDLLDEEKIYIGSGDNKLDGILTTPKGVENPPVVVMVQGSGQSDMDSTIGAVSNKPFKDIAHGLAKNNIASIRYNKRYYQYPQSVTKDITIEEEVLNDVNLAIDFATSSEGIDKDRVYVLGLSLGGMLAPKIALDNEEVDGIISLAGSPRKLEDIIYDQNKDAVEFMDDKSDEEKEAILNQIKAEVDKVKDLKEGDKSQAILGVNSEYWISLNNIDTPKIIDELDVPMLFLQGEEDFQVYDDVDYVAWQELCKDKDNATFKLYEGLNHIFMKSSGKSDVTDYDVKGNVEEEVVSDISNWINNLESK